VTGIHGGTIRLRDGRVLGYAEWGDPDGRPLLEFRGLPSSRLGDAIDPAFLTANRIRRITVDRPGMGLSDYQPHRRLLDWPADVLQLANALQLDRFWLLGTSGGGPYAAACAYRLPDRVVHAGIVSGLGPLDRPGAMDGMNTGERRVMLLARRRPQLARAVVGFAVTVEHHRPGTIHRGLLKALPGCDRAVASRPEVRDSLMDSYWRAFSRGTRGQVHDWGIIASPWGFRPEQIQAAVHLWHGDQDDRVPPRHAEQLAAAIPRSHLTMLAGEGHMIAFSHIQQILLALTGDMDVATPTV